MNVCTFIVWGDNVFIMETKIAFKYLFMLNLSLKIKLCLLTFNVNEIVKEKKIKWRIDLFSFVVEINRRIGISLHNLYVFFFVSLFRFRCCLLRCDLCYDWFFVCNTHTHSIRSFFRMMDVQRCQNDYDEVNVNISFFGLTLA